MRPLRGEPVAGQSLAEVLHEERALRANSRRPPSETDKPLGEDCLNSEGPLSAERFLPWDSLRTF